MSSQFGDAMKSRSQILMSVAKQPKLGGSLSGFVGTGLPGFIGSGLWSDIRSYAGKTFQRLKPIAYNALDSFVQNFAKGYQASPSSDLGQKALSGLSMGAKEGGKELISGITKAIAGGSLDSRDIKGQLKQFDRVGNQIKQVNAVKHLSRPKI